ncbi:pentapeptide repeat-containing protein [Escherichia coli]|nr:pentapeptide repeat-containing protein [Escherichia coli]
MMVTGVSGLASRNFVSLVDNTDIKWANMTTAEKFLHILSLGIWSPEVPEEAHKAFTTWMKDVAWQVQAQADIPDAVSSNFMDITVTYFPNTGKVALSDSNASTSVTHDLPVNIYNAINDPNSYSLANIFLEKHGDSFCSDEIDAVKGRMTDIFQLQPLDGINKVMDKVRELQSYKNNKNYTQAFLSVKMDVSDETITVTLLINNSPFKYITWGKNVSDYLKGINLSGIDLSNSIMKDVDLSEANLTGAKLNKANLAGANLVGANLTRANLAGANLTGANLTRANLAGANLTGANLTGANLTRANLAGAKLTRAKLVGAKLTWVDLREAALEKDVNRVNREGTDLRIVARRTDLRRGVIPSVIDMIGVNLSGVNLSGVNLSGVNLSGVNLSGANLTGANLTGANLTGANLTGANMTGANLTGANMTEVVLSDVIMENVIVTKAVMTEMHLDKKEYSELKQEMRQLGR